MDYLPGNESVEGLLCMKSMHNITEALQAQLARNQDKIKEPVLGIGRGRNGNLVRFLRHHGLEAFGIDRSINHESEYLIRSDWFEFDFGHSRWKTIVSNLSFTNHIVYALRYDRDRIPHYLSTFSKIIESLAEGGTLTYTPSVEILESELEGRKAEFEKWQASSRVAVTKILKNEA